MKKKTLQVALFSIIFFYSGSSFSQDKNQPIKFGALLHITGEWAAQGVAFKDGASLAESKINASGGINGRSVKVVFEDTQYKPQIAHSGAKKLISVDMVSGVIVSTLSEIEAAGPEFERAKIPSIVLWDSSPEIDAIGDYIFSIGPWAPFSGERPADFAIDHFKAKTAAVLYTATPWSESVAKYFEKHFKARGGTIRNVVSFNPGDGDHRSVLSKIKASNPDIIYAPIDYEIMSFFRQLRSLKIGQPIVTSDIITEDNLAEESAVLEGIYQSMVGDPDSEETKRMIADYKDKFKRDCTQILYTAWGYDGIMLLTEAYKNALQNNISDGESIKNELYKIQNYSGASGKISFNAKGSSPGRPSIYQIRSSKFELVE